MNRNLSLLTEAQTSPVTLASDSIVKQCKSGSIAIDTSCVASGYSKETLAELIGKPREVLSRAASGRGGLDIDVLIKLIQQSGSALIIQYMAKQLGGEFRFLDAQEKELREAKEHYENLMAQQKRVA